MSDTDSATIYEQLGVTPVINARGNQTVLGGSMFAPKVQAAMDAANRYFVDMGALQERGGEIIAELVGCEAAFVTPGCAAALALGTAACIAGDDVEKMARLPDTTGMKQHVLIQASQRYHYERATTIVGARLVEVGDADGTSAEQLAAALDDETAVVLVPAHLDGHGRGTAPDRGARHCPRARCPGPGGCRVADLPRRAAAKLDGHGRRSRRVWREVFRWR